MPAILILGSEGFIGSNLVKHFQTTEFTVTGCDLYETSREQNYRYYKVSRLSPGWEEIFSGRHFDFCINAAGSGNVPYSMSHPLADFEANTLDVIRVLDAIRQFDPGCRYVHLSSAAVYGNPIQLPVNESASTTPLSPYGFHKLMSEFVCREYYQVFDIRSVIIRPFSVYGEGLRKQLFWDICNKLKNEENIKLFGTGKESRDFLHVRDLALLIQRIMEQLDFSCNVINAGSGTESTLQVVADVMQRTFKGKKKISFSGEVRKGDPVNWRADTSIYKKLGFTPSITLEDGIPVYVNWFDSI
ncbi:MAG TPA: SDR family oxidoreductase [Flavitalea sp.]|nr:SDR family oxidoreductase [Flavitalea sp.]